MFYSIFFDFVVVLRIFFVTLRQTYRNIPMSSKTREKLIDAARQLFLRKGVENTTISDIATASDKGRRTIYTYFKNKKEIYRAVIESESDNMVVELREIAFSERTPEEKLRDFFDKKLFQTRAPNSVYSSLKALLTIDLRRSDLIRKKAYEKEEALLYYIIDQGVEQGVFDDKKCSLFRCFAYRLIQGIDLLSIHDENKLNDPTKIRAFIDFIIMSVERN